MDNLTSGCSDIMAFFTGDPAGVHPGHDDLAEEIALHGRQFEETKWREEDMQSYLFLLILEVSLKHLTLRHKMPCTDTDSGGGCLPMTGSNIPRTHRVPRFSRGLHTSTVN